MQYGNRDLNRCVAGSSAFVREISLAQNHLLRLNSAEKLEGNLTSKPRPKRYSEVFRHKWSRNGVSAIDDINDTIAKIVFHSF